MTDLATSYLGIPLRHPVIASASPLTKTLDGVRRIEDAGAAAIVLSSLFEEQIVRDHESFMRYLAAGSDSFSESLSYFPTLPDVIMGADEYLRFVRSAKEASRVPIIASLNGITDEGWIEYATLIEQAGADALELNIFYLPVDMTTTARDVEHRYVRVVHAVRRAIRIPLAVKLCPYFSAFGEMAMRLQTAGADGLVLFNRFYQPDYDIDKLEVKPNLDLSTRTEIRLPLLWLAVLHGRLSVSLAATTGVTSHEEVVKYVLAGADVVMTTSSLLRKGPEYLSTIVDGLTQWMTSHDYHSIAEMRGAMSQHNVANPEAYERANYVRILESWSQQKK